jgi:hypothetical protein
VLIRNRKPAYGTKTEIVLGAKVEHDFFSDVDPRNVLKFVSALRTEKPE